MKIDFLSRVRKLASDIEENWGKKNYKLQVFPGIATQGLRKHALHNHFDANQVIQWLRSTPSIPKQLDVDDPCRFGQPPITLYRNPHFLIDLYFWIKPDIAIHDHRFCGAFSLLSGDSLHCLFDFPVLEKPHDHLLLGDLRLRKVEYMKPGAVRAIVSGPAFIHQVWHLSHPTVSIVVRIERDQGIRFHYKYTRSGLAFTQFPEPLERDEINLRRMQMMEFLYRTNHPDQEKYIKAVVREADPWYTFRCLGRYFEIAEEPGQVQDVLRSLKKRRGAWVKYLEGYFRSCVREPLVNWDAIIDEEQRFLIALLLTLPDRESICKTVQECYPDRRAEDSIVLWLGKIITGHGVGFGIPPAAFVFVKHLFQGVPPQKILGELKKDHRDVEKICSDLKGNALLRPLFIRSQS